MSVIAVTGSASGIGAATVARLLAQGHRVIGIDQRDADVSADLSAPEERKRAIDAVAERSGGALDGVVTCAGLAGSFERPGALLASVNYFGTVELLAGLRPLLARGTDAAAVAVSSNSTTTQPGVALDVAEACLAGDEARARDLADSAGSFFVYPATKLAIARWVRRNAVTSDWIGSGIRLNAIAPGVTQTPMVEALNADPVVSEALKRFPLPIARAASPDEIASAIAFLLSREASFFVGSVVFADGGTDAFARADDWPAPISDEHAATIFGAPTS